MASHSVTVNAPIDPNDAFVAVLAAVNDLGDYTEQTILPEGLWGKWSSGGFSQGFLEIEVGYNGTGCRIDIHLRNADMRDRVGLLRREANRVKSQVNSWLAATANPLVPVQAAPRRITDRMVILGALALAGAAAVLGRLYQTLFL